MDLGGCYINPNVAYMGNLHAYLLFNTLKLNIDTRGDLNRSSRIFYSRSNVEKEVTYEEDN